jgi:hypothetical protein
MYMRSPVIPFSCVFAIEIRLRYWAIESSNMLRLYTLVAKLAPVDHRAMIGRSGLFHQLLHKGRWLCLRRKLWSCLTDEFEGKVFSSLQCAYCPVHAQYRNTAAEMWRWKVCGNIVVLWLGGEWELRVFDGRGAGDKK